MKVTFASYQTVLPRHGGPNAQIFQTKRHLHELGIEVQLMDMWQPRNEFFDCDLFHIFASNFSTYDLARYLHEHSHPYVVSPIFFTRRSPRTIRTVCALDRFTRRFVRGLWSDYGFASDICKWSNQALPNTSAEASLLSRGLGVPEDRITVIPNGVESRFADSDPELFYREYGLRDFILNVGHIGPVRKNTLSLIQALKTINHPAVIIGRIFPSREAEACLKEAKMNKNLLIIKGLDHDSPLLASAYAACDVFALPAMYETPGIAALEAGLAGAKVVITPYGGTKDYFKDMAIYVDPYLIKDIRKGIEQALNQKQDDSLKKHIHDNFLWQKVAAKTVKVYQEIMGGE